MKKISVDNGHSFTTPSKAIKALGLDVIANMMDDELRDHINHLYAPCTDAKFVREYLRRASCDLIIG